MQVTTAHAEGFFSKMSLLKTKIRSTMGEDSLESLMFDHRERNFALICHKTIFNIISLAHSHLSRNIIFDQSDVDGEVRGDHNK